LSRCLKVLEGCIGPERRGRERVNEALVGAGHHALRGLDVEVGEERPAWNADEQVVVVLRAWLRGIRAVQRSLERGLSSAVMVELAQVGQSLAELTEHQPVRALCLAEPRPVIPFGLRHPVDMAVVCAVVGARLGLPQEARAELAATALMVDVGLRSVPETIRYREDRLDERDQRVYRGHVVEGLIEILRLPHIKPALQRRMLVLFEHHMGVDGQGFPHVLRWPEAHLYSRIIAVADGYTTLRAEQPGRRALAQDEALAAIQAEAGTRYDPAVVDALATVARAWAAEEEDD
jgi:HD-GYP domain-containing protein (c-di-GMP phosphodiesterase class II)